RLRNIEITQRERIAVLEVQLSDKGAQIDTELINVKSELAISKESEITNKKTIAQLTEKVEQINSELTNVKSELESSKESEITKKNEEREKQQKKEDKTHEITITNLYNELNDTKTTSQTYQDKMKSLGEKISDLESQLKEAKTSNEDHVQRINNLDSTLNET